MEFVFFLPPLFFLLLVLLGKRMSTRRNRNHLLLLPPGPPSIPFIGNWQVFTSWSPLSLWHLSQKYGPIFSLRLGSRRIIVVSSEKITHEAIKDHDVTFSGRVSSTGGMKLGYGGSDMAFAEYGENWKQVRKVAVVNLFSSKRVHSSHLIREKWAANTISEVCRVADAGAVLDMSEMAVSQTSRMTCTMAFGGSCMGGGGWDGEKFSMFFRETQAMLGGTFMADFWPVVGKWVDWITGMDARLEENFKEMDSFLDEVIENHHNSNGGVKREGDDDFVDVLLKYKQNGELSLNQVKGVLMDVLVGGTDTSASAVVWAMTELVRNPKEMKKVQQEVRTLMGNRDIIEEDEVQVLTYMKAVVKEAFRLHPPAPLLVPRETLHGCTLAGYHVPPKAMVIINCWGIGRDPGSWSNPGVFSPERFVGSRVDFYGRDFGFIPFGVGRRICPGIFMGVATVEILLANLLHRFDWELPLGTSAGDIDDEILPGLTMHKKNHLLLVPKRVALESEWKYK